MPPTFLMPKKIIVYVPLLKIDKKFQLDENSSNLFL